MNAMKLLKRLEKEGRISPPPWLPTNTSYLCYMGSVAYGCSNDNSDMDVYGFAMPPVDVLWPHKAGVIYGFGNQGRRFDQWSEHHIQDVSARKEYDFAVYNIVKYFQLCMDNNPNMVDSLFVPRRCVLYSDDVGELVRENRKSFLHKGCWHKFKGYAYSQLHKMEGKNATGKRLELVERYGYDVKFAYHVVRLMLEVEQILAEHDLTLDRSREVLKAIRRGDWPASKVRSYFEDKEKMLEKLYHESTLPHRPDETEIKKLLMKAIRMRYPEHDEAREHSSAEDTLDKIRGILNDNHK